MKVLVFGATGFVGSRVADSLVRAGYKVSGVCRSPKAANGLRRREINPVIADMNDPSSYEEVLAESQVIIVCSCDYTNMQDASKKLTKTICEVAAEDEDSKTVIVTSGLWLWGESGYDLLDETSEPDLPDFLDWKPEHDGDIILNKNLRAGIVVAPGIVYGREGSLTGAWFSQVPNKTINVVGDGKQYWPTVHVDDLAEAYVKIVNANLSGGHLFFVNGQNEQVCEMASAITRTCVGTKVQYGDAKEENPSDPSVRDQFLKCMAMSQKADSSKARRTLGWYPSRLPFTDGVALYYDAWKASKA